MSMEHKISLSAPPFTRSRWTGLLAALGLLTAFLVLQIVVAVGFVLAGAVFILATKSPTGSFMQIVQNGAILGGASAVAGLLTIGLTWLVVSRAGTQPFRAPMALVASRGWPLWAFLPAALVFAVLFDVVTTLLNLPSTPETLLALFQDPISVVVMTLGSVLVAPVAEELVFRGVLFSALERYAPAWLTVLLTTLPFGLMHVMTYGPDWYFILQVTATGLLLGLIRAWTGSLWPGIVFHAVINLYAVIWITIQLHVLRA